MRAGFRSERTALIWDQWMTAVRNTTPSRGDSHYQLRHHSSNNISTFFLRFKRFWVSIGELDLGQYRVPWPHHVGATLTGLHPETIGGPSDSTSTVEAVIIPAFLNAPFHHG